MSSSSIQRPLFSADKVKFYFRSGLSPSGMASVLTAVEETVKSTGEVSIIGKLKNIRMRQKGEGWTGEGSLPKFGQGHNMFGVGLRGTIDVVGEVCELFKVVPEKVDLWDFEFGTSLLVGGQINEYLALLGALSRFLRLPYRRDGLTYRTQEQIIRLYDKLREMSKPDRAFVSSLVPPGMSALKIEVDLKRHAKAQLGWPKDGRCVSFAQLCQPEFHRTIAQHWADKYAQIHKIDTRTMNGHQAFQDCRSMNEMLQWYGMQKMGGPMALLDEIESQNNISKHVKRNMRNQAHSLASHKPGTERHPLICELDRKVLEVLNEVSEG